MTYAAEQGQVATVEQFLLAGAVIKSKEKVSDSMRRDGPWRSVYQCRYRTDQILSCCDIHTWDNSLI